MSETTTSAEPSGAHLMTPTPPCRSLTLRDVPAATSKRYACESLTKAMDLPSGDHAGPLPSVRCRDAPPAAARSARAAATAPRPPRASRDEGDRARALVRPEVRLGGVVGDPLAVRRH